MYGLGRVVKLGAALTVGGWALAAVGTLLLRGLADGGAVVLASAGAALATAAALWFLDAWRANAWEAMGRRRRVLIVLAALPGVGVLLVLEGLISVMRVQGRLDQSSADAAARAGHPYRR
jgi:hypothetical protein